MNVYTERDSWSPEQVAEFKNRGRFRSVPFASVMSAAKVLQDKKHFVAEGDSWFDYPVGTDLIDCLRDRGYQIDNFAKAGDTLENMIFGSAVDGDYAPAASTIGRVLERIGEVKPRVFLFSGGGNDVAGDEFISFLNHRDSGLSDVREEYVEFMVEKVFRKCYEALISKVAATSPATYIVTHGYGHSLPTGKGVKFIFKTWAGPWLLPALAMKRITDPIRQKEIVAILIDALNGMLLDLSNKNEKFKYVDLRPILDPYTDWVNELHLRNSAYSRAAEKIDSVITTLPLD